MLCVFLACISATAAPPEAGTAYVALTETPLLYYESGKPVDGRRLMFQRLVFVGRDTHGVSRFRLDNGKNVKSRAAGLFRESALVPLEETPELAQVRLSYEGHKVWFYGRWSFFADSTRPRLSVHVTVYPTKPVRVAKIYQLAKAPSFDRKSTILSKNLGVETAGVGSLLFVYSRSGKEQWPATNDKGDVSSPRIYGGFYNVFSGRDDLDRFISLKPPNGSAIRAIHYKPDSIDNGDMTARFYGMSHRDIAWAYGFPAETKPISEILKEQSWKFNFDDFRFEGDRVVDAFEETSH